MHTFEVPDYPAVLTEWRTLDERTTDEGRKARGVFFSAKDSDEEVNRRFTASWPRFGEASKNPVAKQSAAAAAPRTQRGPLSEDEWRMMVSKQQAQKAQGERWKQEQIQAQEEEQAAIQMLELGDIRRLSAEILEQERREKEKKALQKMSAIAQQSEDARPAKVHKQLADEKTVKNTAAAKEAAAVRTAGVRFGEISPPRNLLDSSKKGERPTSSDGKRWASYSNLPIKLNQAPVTLPAAAKRERETKPSTKSAFDVMTAAAADQHVRSHTVQVPSTPKQKKEHQPLLEMFWAPKSHQAACRNEDKWTTKNDDAKKDYQPLLEMFEKQLHLLGRGASAASPTSLTQEQPQQPSAKETTEPKQSQTLTMPGELLTLSIQSLLSGVSDLASALKLTSSELQQQIAVAKRDFPKHMDEALKASISAIDNLRSELSAPRVQPSSQHSDRGTQASKPTTSDQATNTEKVAKKGARDAEESKSSKSKTSFPKPYAPSAPFDQQELVKQDMRIDSVVEKMRLALLEMGWRAPATPKGIYTRADILEDFLSYFKKLQNEAELKGVKLDRVDREDVEKPLQPAPPVPAKEPEKEAKKMRDDDKLSLDYPYAWDLQFPANDGWTTPGAWPGYISEHQWDSGLPRDEDAITTKGIGDDRSEYQAFLWDEPAESAESTYQPLSQSETAPAPVIEGTRHKQTLDAWRPLIPQTTAGYQFSPASVMSTQSASDGVFNLGDLPSAVPTNISRLHETNPSVTELADESVMQKFPTVAQFEQRGMQRQTFTKPQPMEPKVSPPTPPSFTKLPHMADWKSAEPRSKIDSRKLSTQASMPAMRILPARQPPAESTPRELYAGFPFQAEAASEMPHTLNESASMSFKPASHRQEHIESTRRSNTVREKPRVSSEAASRARNAAVSRSLRRAEEADRERELRASHRVEECGRRLVEMGFDPTEARRVSVEARGELEKAIDLVEEEASRRKAAKGKGRYMPGAYDDELFG